MKRLCALLLAVALASGETTIAQPVSPPVAARKPHVVHSPNGDREDDYYWLRDDTRQNPDMLGLLKAENAYADAVLAKTKPLADRLYGEIVGRIQQDDSSVPVRERGYWYYTRFEPGADYPVVARRKGAMTAPEEIMLDQPKMAAGKGFFAVGDSVVSQDNRLLAYAEDTVGRRQYVLRFKNLETGETLADAVPNAEPDFVWADDNKTVFYVEKDPVTLLSTTVKAHLLGTPASADRVIYKESDDSFYMGLMRTRSDKYLLRPRGRADRVQGLRPAPARDPLRYRPSRRSLGHPHRLERQELSADDAEGRRAVGRSRGVDDACGAQLRDLHRRLHPVSRRHRDRAANGRTEARRGARRQR